MTTAEEQQLAHVAKTNAAVRKAAEGLAINHGLSMQQAAAAEIAMVELVIEEKRRHG